MNTIHQLCKQFINKIMAEIPEINKRVRQIIDMQPGNSVKKFAESIGVASQTVNRLFNIDTRTQKYPVVTTEVLIAITEMYSVVNPAWLLTGRGEMLKKDENSIGKTDASTSDLAERYLKMLEANARTIESQQQIIADMTKKLGNDAPRRVARAGE